MKISQEWAAALPNPILRLLLVPKRNEILIERPEAPFLHSNEVPCYGCPSCWEENGGPRD